MLNLIIIIVAILIELILIRPFSVLIMSLCICCKRRCKKETDYDIEKGRVNDSKLLNDDSLEKEEETKRPEEEKKQD